MAYETLLYPQEIYINSKNNMKKILLLMMLALSNIMFLSCSSDDDPSTKESYYVKYTLTGSSWKRPAFGHSFDSQPVSSSISYQDKYNTVTIGKAGSINFSTVVGPVDKSFKPFLSASGTKSGVDAAHFKGTIEILKNGNQLIGCSSDEGKGDIYVTCEIDD